MQSDQKHNTIIDQNIMSKLQRKKKGKNNIKKKKF